MPTVMDLVNSSAYGLLVREGFKLGTYTFDAGGAEATLAATYPPVIRCDPGGGAIDLLLPAEADSEGLVFVIFNTADAAEAITVKEDSDTTTIISLAQGEVGLVHCDGTSWLGGMVGATT